MRRLCLSRHTLKNLLLSGGVTDLSVIVELVWINRMKERFLIAVVSLATVISLTLVATDRVYAAKQTIANQQAREAIPSKTFRDAAGRERHITTPLLDKFPYAGDANFCIELREMTKSNPDAAGELLEECDTLTTGTAQEVIQKRIGLATIIGDQDEEDIYSLSENPSDRDKRIVLAISALRASLDAASPGNPAQAFSALENLWIARDVSDAFAYHKPGYLFGPAMKAEAGEAMLTLCPLVGRSDCDIYVPSGMPQALEDIGRWRSDEAMLLRSAELLEREYRSVKNPDKRRELEFAQDYSAKLGYANELNSGNGSAHARRGVKPLEEWLTKYESSTDERQLQYIYGQVGAAYGRIASDTGQRPDAEKAVKFNSLTFEIASRLNKDGPDWENMANLGDDTLLLAELDGQEARFQRALRLHRDAYAKTQKINSQESSAYMNMKLARTLQHYAKAELPSVTNAQKIAMLEEAITLAKSVKPLFEQSATTSYLKITDRVLNEANAQLVKLRQLKRP
jgi:hypothetical protein